MVPSRPRRNWQHRNTMNGVGDIYSSTLGVIRVVPGACKALRRPSSVQKIGAAGNAFAEKAIERSAEAHSVEAKWKGEARRAEPTCHILYAEALRAEGRGPQDRGKILGMVILWGNSSECEACELDSGSAQVIMPKGVS